MDDFDFADLNSTSFSDSGILTGEPGTLNGGDFTTIGTNGVSDLSGGTNGNMWGNIASTLFGLGSTYMNQQANFKAQDALGSGLHDMLNQADPFSASRPKYVNDLNNFMSNPTSYLQTPYAQSVLNAGSQAVDRSMAARGYGGSGNQAIALQRQAMADSGNLLQNQFNNLFQLSGAGQGQLAGADIMGNIAGLNAAKATNGASNFNAYTQSPQQQSSGGGIGSTLGGIAGSIFGGPIGGSLGGALGGLLDSIF